MIELSTLLILFVLLMAYWFYVLWFKRGRTLNLSLQDLLGPALDTHMVSSEYIKEESASISSIYSTNDLNIFFIHFFLSGSFRKQFYLVIESCTESNENRLFGVGHIYREMKYRRPDFCVEKLVNYKEEDDIFNKISKWVKAVEKSNGRKFYYVPLSSVIGSEPIKEVLEKLGD